MQSIRRNELLNFSNSQAIIAETELEIAEAPSDSLSLDDRVKKAHNTFFLNRWG